ncbi:MAG: peptidylprolyl isomerase, partial [Syntrophales bacterium]|nr:peptidylprolyl isomerase [Syntrophales bacterium]
RLSQVRPEVRRQIIDYFIVNNLLNNEIRRLQIQIADREIKEAMETLKGSLPSGVTMEDMMKKNKISQKELKQKVVTGLSVRKLVSMQPLSKTKITDKDIGNFYRKNPDKFKIPELVHARHILVAVNKVDDVAAKAKKKEKAEGIRKQLLSGGDFAEMAKMGSDCPSKDNGGDLGQFARGQMVKPFDDAAFNQKKDEIGPVVETEFGYHIIQVLDRTASRMQPLDKNTKAKILAYLQQQKDHEAYNALMNQLKTKAKIYVSDRME